MRIATLVIGILASSLVLLSYIFSNQKLLRIVNLVASIIFVIYGFGLVIGPEFDWTGYDAWPTVILNTFCAIVHIRWLILDKKKSKKGSAESRQKDETTEESNNSEKFDK